MHFVTTNICLHKYVGGEKKKMEHSTESVNTNYHIHPKHGLTGRCWENTVIKTENILSNDISIICVLQMSPNHFCPKYAFAPTTLQIWSIPSEMDLCEELSDEILLIMSQLNILAVCIPAIVSSLKTNFRRDIVSEVKPGWGYKLRGGWAQSTTKDDSRTENKLQSTSKLFIQEVIIPQVSFPQNTTQILSTILECKPGKTTNTCLGANLHSTDTKHRNLHPAGRPILFCRPTQVPMLATANTGKTWKRL